MQKCNGPKLAIGNGGRRFRIQAPGLDDYLLPQRYHHEAPSMRRGKVTNRVGVRLTAIIQHVTVDVVTMTSPIVLHLRCLRP